MPFSLEQMTRQYHNAGVTAAIGLPSIATTEGCCVGGSTGANSALFRRPPEENADRAVAAPCAIDGLHADEPMRSATNRSGVVGEPAATAPPPPSRLLRDGAASLGWAHDEPALDALRRSDGGTGDRPGGCQAAAEVTATYLPRTLAAGGRSSPGHVSSG